MEDNGWTGLAGDMFIIDRDAELVEQDDISFTDEDWVADRFMVSGDDMEEDYNFLRFSSTVDAKFTDTTMGGSISLNCLPQYTRYADVRSVGLYGSRPKVKVGVMSTDNGLGRYYSEGIDDNSTNVYFEFGVADFNNFLSFLMGAVDYKKAVIANTARTPFFYNAGWAFGTGALILAFPIIAPILLLAKLGTSVAATLLADNGRFDQYYLKRTMFMYWSVVNSIVTMMSTEIGLLTPEALSGDSSKLGGPLKLNADDVAAINIMMPDLITAKGGINVQAMVTKAQKAFNKMTNDKLEKLELLSNTTLSKEEFNKLIQTTSMLDNLNKVSDEDATKLFDDLQAKLEKDKRFTKADKKDKVSFTDLVKKLKDDGKDLRDSLGPDKDGKFRRDIRKNDSKTYMDTAKETAKAIFNEGARYSVFRVEHVESSAETFSNDIEDVAIGNAVNSMGSTWRNLKFNMGLDGIPGISSAVNAVTEFALGTASGVTMGFSDVIGGILSGANVDVQKKWAKSTVTFPTRTFKMSLVSPSPHPVAQLKNIYIPLAGILAGVLPLSTGPRSGTSPFLCSMYVRGMQRINLGMIKTVTITRGSSNLPFNKQRRPLAVDVTFTVVDFSQVVTAPTPSGLLDLNNVMYDDESGLSRYIQALCGRDLYSSTHAMGKAKIKFSRFMQTADIMMTPEYMGARVGDMVDVGGVFSLFGGNKAASTGEIW